MTPVGYLALGSNAEYRSLSDAEQMRVLEVFAEEKGNKVVMAGTGCESAHETIEKSKRVAAMGFPYVSVLTPGYFAGRMDGVALKTFYERVADAIPVPLVIYNAPAFAGGVQVPPDVVAELARHPNIAGIKDSSPLGPGRYLDHVDSEADFAILAGSASVFYPSLLLGAEGGILALANYLPGPPCELVKLYLTEDRVKALALHHRIARVNAAVTGAAGVAGVKAAMEMMGFRGGEPRCPLSPVSDTVRAAIRRTLIEEGFLEE
jgi:4-hydroxy-2-oxoglutarate aldolase